MPTTPEEQDHSTAPHYTFIRSRLPAWLKNASAEQYAGLRSAIQESNISRIFSAHILSHLKSIEAFAEPILELGLRPLSPDLTDMQAATLVKRWKRDSLLGIPLYDASPEHSLLEAALYNFEEWETRDNGFGSGSAIYPSGKAAGLKSSLTPKAFAQHCRTLNLGLKYQHHLKQILDLDRPADEIMLFAHKREHFVRHEWSRFKVALWIALMKKDITDACAARLKYFLLPVRQRIGKLPLYEEVKLLGHTLPGVIHLSSDPDDNSGPCAIYFSDHPEAALKEYPSLVEFQEDYLEQLRSVDFRQLISRLMPIDYQGRLLAAKISQAASGRSPAQLRDLISLATIDGELFEEIHWQRLRRLENDVGRLATPRAQANAISREALLDEYHSADLDLLFGLKAFIPRFHQTLLAPPGSQLTAIVYQDFSIWSAWEMNAGLIHLLNVAETAKNSRTFTAAEGLPELIPVRFQGRTRLWNPDLTPYQSAIRPADEHWQADSLGLYPWAQATVLKLDQQYYQVEHNEDTDRWHIVLTDYPGVYAPPLRHNGVGAWRTIHEDVSMWSQQQLITRLGPPADRLSESLASAALTFSGTRLDTLRQIHHYSRRTPPLLLDSLKRLWIFQEIERFDFDRARGNVVSQLSPRIQSYLLTRLPGWPKGKMLEVLRGSSQGAIQYGAGSSTVSISEEHWMAGKLLDVLLKALDPEEIDGLLESNTHQPGQLNPLALNLLVQAKLQSQALLEYLYIETEQPDTATQRRIRQENAELPKSHLADAIFSLDIQEQSASETGSSLKREIDRALEQVHISRVFEGLYPGWPHTQQSDRLAFSLLETLGAWPQDIRLELWDTDIDIDAALESIGRLDSLTYRCLKKTGAFYLLQDRQGNTLSGPHDLYTGAWLAMPKLTQQALNSRLDISLDEKRAARDLQQAVFYNASILRSEAPALRVAQHTLGKPELGSRTRFPESFAVGGTTVSGLDLREDGIFWNLNNKPLAAHAYSHYIRDSGRYYPVRQTPEGWRLLNARTPYSFYQPLLQRKTDGGWMLHPGTDPADLTAGSLSVQTQGSAPSSHLDDRSFTQAQRVRMRSRKSYRDHLNSPLTYDRVDNGRYPLRDLDGHPMTIVAIHYSEAEGSHQSKARAQQVIPYLQLHGYETVARLYEDKLEIGRFEHDDISSTQEEHLAGRFLVSAKRRIRRGEILGVYGGMLIPLITSHHRRDPFATRVRKDSTLELIRFRTGRPEPAAPCLSGDNILSRINTRYEYSNHVPIRQAEIGYDVESVAFAVDIQGRDGSLEKDRYFITALFASQTIFSLSELRLNHGYTWEQIETLEILPRSP
ncbi:hypothetical protein HX882_15025 [Pseudomonas gingeri]|uniref:Dermonecrotic toxin N-terminal domain-containing protein n=1 Tax=Pseudomonas gingeri TaxID=117681 RepID=A0A7Y7XCG1_9PSED|nr:DUF6543 domain-containing protein [Pseudomonas gingeri]NWB97211.1 hypothetical protein [Pseudomonas gingeri]